jgi:6-phosphogluconolactonase
MHFYWGDERCVPADDPQSNARMALDLLLKHVPVPRTHIHPLSCERAPSEAAWAYEAAIRDFFAPEAPCFDLILLGLGENGHTASLFPDDPILDEQARLVKELYVPEQNLHRVSFTAPLINQAAHVVFLVHGSTKAQVLKDVLQGPYEPRRLPAQLISPVKGELVWLVDRDAASRLEPSSITASEC